MRYYAVNLSVPPEYHYSGQYVSKTPYKHPRRELGDYELFFVTEGELWLEQVGEYCVKKGEVLLHGKGEIQSGSRIGTPTVFHWFHFDGEVKAFTQEEKARAFCEKNEKWIFFAEKFTLPYLERILLLLAQFDHSSYEKERRTERNFLCGAVLSELAFQYGKASDSLCTNKRFLELLLWANERLADGFSVAELAEKFEYNPKYLSALFKKYTGKTVKEYLTEKRIELAKRLLSLDNAPVKAVARAVGYDDEYYFMRVFKKQTGFTPKHYRKAFSGCVYKN